MKASARRILSESKNPFCTANNPCTAVSKRLWHQGPEVGAAIYIIGFNKSVRILNYFMQAAFISESLYHFIFAIPQFLLCSCLERRKGSFG